MADQKDRYSDSGPAPRVLIVDDELGIRSALRRSFRSQGFDVQTLDQGLGAVDTARRFAAEVVLLDIRMPGANGLDVLEQLKTALPEVEVLIMTGYGGVDSALRAVRAGAFDYLTKPFSSMDDVSRRVRQACERGRLVQRNRELEVSLSRSTSRLIGSCAAMAAVHHLIEAVAPSNAAVLIQGETGTGKELVAREIHGRSRRSEGAFLAIDCSSLSQTLLESQLFGHVRGAFTGAAEDQPGLFRLADGGTLFMDEIVELTPATQAAVLRVLQERELRPLGGSELVPIDVRLVCASHVDLQQAVADGHFREDLYYRIHVLRIELPPLRDRDDDVLMLAQHFLRQAAARGGGEVQRLSPDGLAWIRAHRWPGNVRELGNCIERAVVMSGGQLIERHHLSVDLPHQAAEVSVGWLPDQFDGTFAESKRSVVRAFERRYVQWALHKCDGKLSEAARLAGLDRSNFRRIARRCGALEDRRDLAEKDR